MRRIALAAFAILATACGPSAVKTSGCQSAWAQRATAVDSLAQQLDAAQTAGPDKEAAIKAEADSVEKQLHALTIPGKDREMYPEKLKAMVAKKKMRLATMSPLKREPGNPLTAVQYDIEIQGDYRTATKVIAAFYDQPKVFLFDRVELNITDVYRHWSTIKAKGVLFETPELPAPTAATAAGPLAAALAALDPQPPAECEGVPAPPAAAATIAKRTALLARSEDARVADQFAARQAQLATRKAIVDQLTRQRDDNKAAFTSHSDELVRRAQSAVTMFCVLSFNARGEPDWH